MIIHFSNENEVSVDVSFGDVKSLIQLQERFIFSKKDCEAYRGRLDNAAGNASGRPDQNIDWRYRIARWLIQCSDDLNLSRDTALIALMYCDRFMIKKEVIQKRIFQLASITCLFVASKLHEKGSLDMVRMKVMNCSSSSCPHKCSHLHVPIYKISHHFGLGNPS